MQKRDIAKDREFCANIKEAVAVVLAPSLVIPMLEHYIDRAEAAEVQVADLGCAVRSALARAEAAETRVAELEALVSSIIPKAMWASCAYREHKDADPTTHCCDWSKVVEDAVYMLRGTGV